ncbi:conserved hypothetical protein [Treponema primitia ZAS-2]|uniref:Ribosomal RNA small subunit methyltransferase E n=1 Tax=Treponema primitia (strain ATCC BAA-887 / DSM 12427 / ZAS-2) TaxID=545694 RepID=F5YNC9_TREPZ|nr:RsmE family RNA methyltransferase [Treponema primitia]AEF86310.1 conserved hypothetical protein [Treponema primitia ZAS-2]
MKQFILNEAPDSGGVVRLSGKDFHYLVRVRRLKEGAVFEALLPPRANPSAEADAGTSRESTGVKVRVLVQSLAGGVLTGECLPVELIDETALPPIILFQALPKGAKLDLIVRQATEGGINEIRPFISDYAVPRGFVEKDEQDKAGRVERWRRIIKEARQQSGSSIATEIEAPCTVEALLEYWGELRKKCERPLGIILHQTPQMSTGPRGSVGPLARDTFHDYLSINPDLVALAVGPEGGFSPDELSRFLAAGFKPLVIGNTILRTETAALYAAAAVRVILLENKTWTLKYPDR